MSLIQTELLLSGATHSAKGSVRAELATADGTIALLEPVEQIELAFASPPPPPPRHKRRYLLDVTGTYTRIPSQTGTEEHPSHGPHEFSFEQAYPNPANPTTEFRYSLPEGGPVVLALYNVLGQRVRTLVDEYRPAGRYTISWDGHLENGSSAASGVYFAKLTAGSYSATRKVTVVK